MASARTRLISAYYTVLGLLRVIELLFMAHKRMFSKDITASDAFLDMPSSSQSLYFHLGMEADDDGFIGNPKKVMRVIGVGEDDFKILLAKKFVLDFPSGVVVVKHHRINNNWDKYNCKRTTYLEEFSQLHIKENKAYTLDEKQGIPLKSANSLQTVFRIEENRIDNTSVAVAPHRVKDSEEGNERTKKTTRADKDYDALISWLEKMTGVRIVNRVKQYTHLSKAKAAGISPTRLKNRASELYPQDWYQTHGLDWGGVVSSFDKKA